MSKKIAVLVGSVDPDSLNMRLAKAMELGAPEDVEFVYAPIGDLEFYQRGYDTEPTEAGKKVRDIVSEADGVLVVTPEYNRSMPGVLKNALDWLSRPGGNGALRDKPMLIAGASGGGIGTAVAQSQVRAIVPMIGVNVMGTPELYIQITKNDFAEDGEATTQGTQDFLASSVAKFSDFIDRLN